MATQYSFAKGAWRVRFTVAQRKKQNATDPYDTQRIRVTVATSTAASAEIEVANFIPNPGDAGGDYFEYATRPFTVASNGTNMRIKIQGLPNGIENIALLDNIVVEPVRQWTDNTSWKTATGGATVAPTASDNVSIPSGAGVALGGACSVATANVQGELLVTNADSSLNARWIMVMGSGACFEVGTADCPFQQNFTLTLTGTNTSENIMGAGSKFLMAMGGGRIDMHGIPKTSWTRLAGIITANVSQITLVDSVNWSAGDEIVIAPSTVPFLSDVDASGLMKAIEVRKIAANGVSTDGLTLTLKAVSAGTPSYRHNGKKQNYTRPSSTAHPTATTWTVDERAEVGLLTHNVVIQGDGATVNDTITDASGTYTNTNRFGGHVMIMRKGLCPACDANGGGFGRFSGVMFKDMGQEQRMARYPVHWHMEDDGGKDQFIKNCSIWHSANRAITLHGTSFVTVQNNVAFDHIGHGIFMEDGVEHDNIIDGNLVLGTKQAQGKDNFDGIAAAGSKPAVPANRALIPSDNMPEGFKMHAPSAFWITNPNNTITNNVAAGTLGTGFWFALPSGPMNGSAGDSRFVDTSALVPATATHGAYYPLKITAQNHEALGTFSNNTVHSAGGGFLVNDLVQNYPRDTTDPDANNVVVRNKGWEPPVPAVLSNFNIYATKSAIYCGFGNDSVTYHNAILADNYEHVFFAAPQTLEESLMVASTSLGQAYVGYDSTGGSWGTFAAKLPNTDVTEYYKYAAYVSYDGPGQMKNCHLVGYNADGTTLIKLHSASIRHTNHLFSGLTFDHADAPIIDFDAGETAYGYNDFSAVTASNNSDDAPGNPDGTHSKNNPKVWGIVIRDVDGSASGHLNYPDWAGRSIVTNQPFMTSSDDYTWPVTGSNVHLSKRKFGYFSLTYNSGSQLPNLDITRTGGTVTPSQQSSNSVTFHDGAKIFGRHSLSVIANEVSPANQKYTYTYTFDFTPDPSINKISVNIDDLDPGDYSPVFCFKALGSKPGLNVSQIPSTTKNSIINTPLEGYAIDGSDLYFRLKIPAGKDSRNFSISWTP